MKISIKAARVNKGLTQSEAAQLIGVTRKTLGTYETGKAYPKVNIVEKMGDVYGVDKEAFIFLQTKNA